MAIVQISKIQHRTGANIDLPQLDEGEIGFSTDEQKLFIGNDPILYPVPNGQTTTQLEILTEVSNLDFAKVIGSANTELQITSPKVGQLLVADGSSNTMVATTFVNWTGNLLGNGHAHSNNKLHLGGLANIEITGGMNGGVLSTDGAGNLYWTTVAGGGGGDGLPAQNNNSGKYLKTNGTVATWENVFSDTNFATTVRSNISVGYNSGYGNLSYSSSNGVITFTGVSPTDIRGQFSAGTGVTYYSANGQFSIAQDVATDSDVTFNTVAASNVSISGLYQVDDPGAEVPTVRNSIVYNNSSNTLATNSGFFYDPSHNTVTVGKIITDGNITIGTTNTDGSHNIGYLGLANITSGATTKAPDDSGVAGQICWDTQYIYICTHQDTWEKIQIGATVSGGGSSYSDTDVATYLTAHNYITTSDLPDLSGYVTGTPWTSQGYLTSADLPDLSGYVTSSSLGNIATIDLDGNSGNILYGNGVFATAPQTPNLQIVLSAGATATSSATLSGLTLNDTSESTDTTTGALVVDGGVGVAKNLNVGGNVTLAAGTDVFAIKGTGANAYISVDSSGVAILSKPNESGSGIYITDSDNSVSVLIGDSANAEVANAVVKFTTNELVPSWDNQIDLGVSGSAWKSLTTRTATLAHNAGSLSLFANATGLFATNGTTTYQLNWTIVP